MADFEQTGTAGYRYLEEIVTADVAFEAWGVTLEELFRVSADAVLNVMIEDIETVHRESRLTIELANPELDLLLFGFLNELLFFKDARMLLLRLDRSSITEGEDGFSLRADMAGERLDTLRHTQLVDVKAVTLHRLRVAQTSQGWEATVVLDI